MADVLTTPCAAGTRTLDRVRRLESDIDKLCSRLERQNAEILSTLEAMRRETAARFEAWSERDQRASTATATKLASLQREVDDVRSKADLRRSLIGAATAVCLSVAVAVIVFLLKGCS